MQLDEYPFDKYEIQLDTFATGIVDGDISRKGLLNTTESLLGDADCTKLNSDGIRLRQTIDFTYRNTVSKILYCIRKMENVYDRTYYYEQLLNVHKRNLEYEELNPPVVYPIGKSKPKTKSTRKASKLPRKGESVKASKTPTYKDVYLNTNLIHNFKLKKL